MNSKQPHFAMHPSLPEHKYTTLHSSSEAIRRACLQTPQVNCTRKNFHFVFFVFVLLLLHVALEAVGAQQQATLRGAFVRTRTCWLLHPRVPRRSPESSLQKHVDAKPVFDVFVIIVDVPSPREEYSCCVWPKVSTDRYIYLCFLSSLFPRLLSLSPCLFSPFLPILYPSFSPFRYPPLAAPE